jgi:16S rRNA (guanine1516-N2)-methyltransferase
MSSVREHLQVAACADPASDENLLRAAARLSVDLNIPFLEKPLKKGVDALLVATHGRLELRMIGGDPITRGGRAVCVDWSKIDVSSAQGKRIKQPIAKAIGIKSTKEPPPVVIDATAGWGEDSWLLAGLGCRVLSVERNKIVATLLRDGLLRAAMALPEVAMRITLVQTSAIALLRRIAYQATGSAHNTSEIAMEDLPAEMEAYLHPDVVFLDPMFPPRKKGAEGKPMKVIRQLVGDDDDADQLLDAALRVARKRVVVKRPIHGEALGGREADVTHEGKSMRYDVYCR